MVSRLQATGGGLRATGCGWLILVCVIVAVAGDAVADTVHTRQAKSYRQIRIVGFARGRIEAVEKKSGKRSFFEFDKIALIRVDKKPLLNQAEKLLALKQYAKAIDAYGIALEKASSRWEKTWIKVRLMRLLAAGNQLDRAIEIYIDLSRTIPGWVLQVAPVGGKISGDEKQRAKAAAALMRARDRASSPKRREALSRFLERLGYEQRPTLDEQDEQEPVRKTKKTATMDFRRPGLWLDAFAEEKLAAGKYDRLSEAADKLFKIVHRADLAGILYWQGRVMLADGKYDRAALRLLRVAIEFPRSKYAPYALYHTADAMSKRGRTGYAQKVRRELVRRYEAVMDVRVSMLVDSAREATEANKPNVK